ncbi:hypothetical protein BBJ28_00012173 [Nothophytophthora sp. Chile5]|nr:hypothetical protein BBJ28_00012173 [Nothophytophthora sp. Chile5]
MGYAIMWSTRNVTFGALEPPSPKAMADSGDAPPSATKQRSRAKKPPKKSAQSPPKQQNTLPSSRTRSNPRSHRAVAVSMGGKSPVGALPSDLLALVLPFLTWKATNAMLLVCSSWKSTVLSAKARHAQWKATVLGPASSASASLELLRTNRKNWMDTRFAPNLVLLTIASQESASWQKGAYWEKAVVALEEQHMLPIGCRVVGTFTTHAVLGPQTVEEEPERDAPSTAVTLSIAVAHLPDTSIEAASFDRKTLRRHHRGVESEMDYVFSTLPAPEGTGADADLPSFLLFGVNDQSADELVSVVEQWHPGAAVVGAVSSLGDRCSPLATYQSNTPMHSGATVATCPPRQQRRKGRAAKQPPTSGRTRPRGLLEFPSTLLLRFHGKVGVRAFASSGYRPITPVLRCESTSVEGEFTHMTTYACVSVQDPPTSSVVSHHRLLDLVEPSERLAIEQEGRGLNIFSCPEQAPLQRLARSTSALPGDLPATARVDRLEHVFWMGERVMSLPGFCWEPGMYGFLASHCPKQAHLALTAALRHVQTRLNARKENALGAFMAVGALSELAAGDHAHGVSALYEEMFRDLPLSGCVVSCGVGPVAVPGGSQPSPLALQVQTHTTCGAMFYEKSSN